MRVPRYQSNWVYKTYLISTIVDSQQWDFISTEVYKTYLISTIVDFRIYLPTP